MNEDNKNEMDATEMIKNLTKIILGKIDETRRGQETILLQK